MPLQGLHHAWIVLAVTFVSLLTSAAVLSLPGVLIHALEAEFGWDRTAVALAVSINMLLFGLVGPFLGRLKGRVGPRARQRGDPPHRTRRNRHPFPDAALAYGPPLGPRGRYGIWRRDDGDGLCGREPLVLPAPRPRP
jgi:MFS family permease